MQFFKMANTGHVSFSEIKFRVMKSGGKKKKSVKAVVLDCNGSNSQIQRFFY